ncbi:MAG: tryptophan synthase subunit alpha [Chitinophagales bacterium]|nr:tryptophan synthase subunit alpha [Chitinophagales bacterium]
MKDTRRHIPVMAHLVLGYPSLETSIQTAAVYANAGVVVLELQIPFSHPTADGPVITEACRVAVEQGVDVPNCLQAIAQIRAQFPKQEIMVMSYLNRIYAYGFQRFIANLAQLNIRHIIIPDLPVSVAASFIPPGSAVQPVPVLAANTSPARLESILKQGYDFFYLMSDFKITGSGFSLHPNLSQMIAAIKAARPENRTGIGFGISSPEQVALVTREADLAIIGSALITAEKNGNLEQYLESLREVFHDIPTN